MATYRQNSSFQGRFSQAPTANSGTYSAGLAAIQQKPWYQQLPQAPQQQMTPPAAKPVGTLTYGQNQYTLDPNTNTWALTGGPNAQNIYGTGGNALPSVMPKADIENLQSIYNQGQQSLDPGFGTFTDPRRFVQQNRGMFSAYRNPGDFGAQNLFGGFSRPYNPAGFQQMGGIANQLGALGRSAPIAGMGQLGSAISQLMGPQGRQMSRFLNTQAVNIDPVIEALRRDYTTQLQESVLPGLRSGAVASGQYGGSRQALAEGVAASKANEEFQQQAANLRYQNELNALQQRMAAAQAVDALQQQGLISGGELAQQRAATTLASRQARAQALAQAGDIRGAQAELDQAQRAQRMQALSQILGARQAGQAQGLQATQALAGLNESARGRAMEALQGQLASRQLGIDTQQDAAQTLAQLRQQYYASQAALRSSERNAAAAQSRAGIQGQTQRDIARMNLGPSNINAIANLINSLGVGYGDVNSNAMNQAALLGALG